MKKLKNISFEKGCLLVVITYAILTIAFYLIAGDTLNYSAQRVNKITTDAVTPMMEITNGTEISQTFVSQTDILDQVSLLFNTYGRVNKGTVKLDIEDIEDKKTLSTSFVDMSVLKDNKVLDIQLNEKIENVKGKKLDIKITVPNGSEKNTVTVWYDDKSNDNGELFINGEKTKGALYLNYSGRDSIYVGKYYFAVASILGCLLIGYCLSLVHKRKKGINSFGLRILDSIKRYNFLLRQLVNRDFKTKYKRSILGILWSFLNPLLTMIVQYIIFSTLFKSDIDNFPVYLLTGIVLFNFFSESTSLSLGAIIGNASLITKLYVPKYIFPISRVFSSAINLFLSLIPLIIVILLTGTKIKFSFILISFCFVCLIIFCIGMSFILSSCMVFFRDTQFLWNVISMLWVYMTPIFYPESIIPERFSFVLKLNPMYHFIRFGRTVIIQGVSPEPKAYLYCIIAALGTFIVGTIVFKKTQDKFVLNI